MRERKRVIMVTSQYPPVYGGAGAQASLLARALTKEGWDCEVVTLDQNGVGSACEAGVSVRRFGRGLKATGVLSRISTTLLIGLAAAYRVLRLRPEVVHIHGAYWWSIPPALAAKLVKARLVLKSTRDGEDDARTLRSKRVFGIPVGRLYGCSLALADIFVVLNSESFQRAEEQGYGAKTCLMLNGVDDKVFGRSPERRASARQKFGLRDEDKLYVFVGYLVRHKGVHDLISAWLEGPADHRKLWLVGPISGFYRELDDDLGAGLKNPALEAAGVSVLGHIDQADLPEIYWAADVFVLPSYAEGMPNSLLEAIVAGCEVIATDIPGIRDLFDDTSKLIKPGDRVRLAEQLVSEPGRFETKELRDRLRISCVAREYLELYEPTNGESRSPS